MKLGFIGLGKMGKPMAANLLKAGHECTVYNRSLKAVNELVELGASRASSPAEVGRNAEVVCLCLPIGRDVEAIVCGQDGLLTTLPKGALIIDHSTISPEESRRIHDICLMKGISFLDAPVSGGVTGAEKGTLSIMAGGEEDQFLRAKMILEIMGKNIYYLGSSGSGNAMKLVNNMLVGISTAAISEAFVLAVKSGLDPEQVFEILSNSSGDSYVLRRHLPNFILKRNFAPAFTLDMLNKDLGLAENFALDQGVRLLIGSLAHQICREAAFTGLGGEDMSAAIKILESQNRLEVSADRK